MKIIVWMDERGEIWAHHEQGDRREACFFKTEEETEEELRAWGYPLLVDAYPAMQIEAGHGIAPQETGRRLSDLPVTSSMWGPASRLFSTSSGVVPSDNHSPDDERR